VRACLYQALAGDGYDQIKGVAKMAAASAGASDGNFEDELKTFVMLKDMPPAMWTKASANYIVIDGFSMPFQYVKAMTTATLEGEDPRHDQSTYDLWSYAEDETNTSPKIHRHPEGSKIDQMDQELVTSRI
jgi:hypothetical protein